MSSLPPTPRRTPSHGIQLEVVKLPQAVRPKHGFVLLPQRRVVERTFLWLGRTRRLGRDYGRLPASSEALI